MSRARNAVTTPRRAATDEFLYDAGDEDVECADGASERERSDRSPFDAHPLRGRCASGGLTPLARGALLSCFSCTILPEASCRLVLNATATLLLD